MSEAKTPLELAEEFLAEIHRKNETINEYREQLDRAHRALDDSVCDERARDAYFAQYRQWRKQHD